MPIRNRLKAIRRDKFGVIPLDSPVTKRKTEQTLRAQQLSKYGLSLDDYNAMLKAQQGLCAICGNRSQVSVKGTHRRLSIDHDHSTGKVRALLCSQCNTGLGLFKDDIDRLHSAILYLKKHKNI